MMETEILNSNNLYDIVNKSVNLLNSGEIIAFPTETVYGLGGNIYDDLVINKIFQAKNRPVNNPLAAHFSDIKHLQDLWKYIPDEFYALNEKFLPGPLAIIFNKSDRINDNVTSGFKTLSIRIPDNQVFQKISEKFNYPIAATSANLSGKPSPINASNVVEDLFGKIPLIIDDGIVKYGFESTVLSLVDNKPIIFREGIISKEEIEIVLNKPVEIINNNRSQYAPKAEILVFSSINDFINYYSEENKEDYLIISEFETNEIEYIDLKPENLFNYFRESDRLLKKKIILIYNPDNNKLLNIKVSMAMNQQKRG